MQATIEDLNIILGALTSCKTKDEIVRNVKLSPAVVNEVLETLRRLGRISKDEYTDTYCPIGQVAEGISASCNLICETLKSEV